MRIDTGSTLQPHGAGMMDGFTAKPLSLNKINQAYALVRTARPAVTADVWRDVATDFLSASAAESAAPRGVITVQNDQGYILGLFCYAACDHLRHGRALAVENLMALDLFDSVGAMGALLRAMEDLARRLGCAAVLAETPAHCRTGSDSCRLVSDWFCNAPDSDSPTTLVRLLNDAPCRPLRAGAPDRVE